MQHTVYVFNGFQLDVTRRKLLSSGGLVLPLNSRALDALLVLLANAGEVVEKRRLMDAVWPNTVVEENNLNQCIAAIRKALGEVAGTNRFVLTVPGRGYAFVCPVRKSIQESDSQATHASRREKITWWGAGGIVVILLALLVLRIPTADEPYATDASPQLGLQLEDSAATRSLLANCLASRPDLKLRIVVELVGDDAAETPVWSGHFNAGTAGLLKEQIVERVNADSCSELVLAARR